MTSYLARLKARTAEQAHSGNPQNPQKPVEAPFEPFEGGLGGRFSRPAPEDRGHLVAATDSPPVRPDELCNALKGNAPSMAAPAGSTNERTRAEGENATAILRDKYEERAAILEYEANLPRAWAEHFARIEQDGPPGDFSPTRWEAALDGALVFADQWGAEAHRLGWDVSEVFGLHPTAPAARVDCRGLAWLLGDGSQVVAMDRCGANIKTARGGHQRFHRSRGNPSKRRCENEQTPALQSAAVTR